MIELAFILLSTLGYRIRGHGTPLPGPLSALAVWAAPTAIGAWWIWGMPVLHIEWVWFSALFAEAFPTLFNEWSWFGVLAAESFNAYGIPAVLALWLVIAETQLGKWADWGPQPESNEGWKPWPLIWRGSLAAMPLYPYCYWLAYRFRQHWPDAGPLLRSHWWTAWAETFCGLQTPIALILIGMMI